MRPNNTGTQDENDTTFTLHQYINSKEVQDKLRKYEGWSKNISLLNPNDEGVKIMRMMNKRH